MQSDLGLCFDALFKSHMGFVFINCRTKILFVVTEIESGTASIRDVCRKLNDCLLSNARKTKFNFSRTNLKQNLNRLLK